MTRNAQWLATIIVGAAIAVMLGLGFWQLERAKWKDALIAQYESALGDDEVIAFPRGKAEMREALFRRSAVDCQGVIESGATAAHNQRGTLGYAQVKQCATDRGTVDVLIGWSRDPSPVEWEAGVVTGLIVPGQEGKVRLQADPPQAGLEPFERPDPSQLPDNHMSYAVQWFAFAFIALTIFILALRRRRGENR
ncbi:SURF1 family cytochrome oxidase biogenesis protein [Sphingomicrobium lutaoense]|uniref:SURF1-like protein n=1 Tax=Sphingomicrobium lutaoense TaxID=515949 RepID=A0A839Z518_9SPHN|nr:SURF1 family cytochrome oxidase biogenesis protein [Sphingomicrobium lutaoense]MBB3764973.1 surfeit locus 1 family protein [Sphingomicrobium lutaoense]